MALMDTAMLASTISTPGIGRYTSQERTKKISIVLMQNYEQRKKNEID